MNIIEVVRQIISEFPRIAELPGGVDIDFSEADPGNCGLYPTGDQLLKEDVIGNQERQHNFILYAVFNSFTDYNALMNTSFLLELAYWLEKAAKNQPVDVTIGDTVLNGKLTKLSSTNGMLYSYEDGTRTGPVKYQLQIYAKYEIESED